MICLVQEYMKVIGKHSNHELVRKWRREILANLETGPCIGLWHELGIGAEIGRINVKMM